MSDVDPEGFNRGPDGCICGPIYHYAGHEEPGQYAPDCPYHQLPDVEPASVFQGTLESGDVVSRARAALDGITPGGWATYMSDKGQIAVVSPDEKFFIALLHPDDCDTDMGRANIALIADAPTLVRDLLAEVERLRSNLDLVRRHRDAYLADRDEARAAIDRVRKLADDWEAETSGDVGEDWRAIRLRRALDGEA